jgi:hypothetical protein
MCPWMTAGLIACARPLFTWIISAMRDPRPVPVFATGFGCFHAPLLAVNVNPLSLCPGLRLFRPVSLVSVESIQEAVFRAIYPEMNGLNRLEPGHARATMGVVEKAALARA